jgi:hypothetical protein
MNTKLMKFQDISDHLHLRRIWYSFQSILHMLLFRLTNNEQSQSGSENCSTSGHMSVLICVYIIYIHINTKINQPLVRQQKQKCEISDVTIPLILTQYTVKCFTGVEKGDKYIRNGNCLLAVNTCSSCCVHVKNLQKKYSILQVGSGDIWPWSSNTPSNGSDCWKEPFLPRSKAVAS